MQPADGNMIEMQDPTEVKTTSHRRKRMAKQTNQAQIIPDDSVSNNTHQSMQTINTVMGYPTSENGAKKQKEALFDLE